MFKQTTFVLSALLAAPTALAVDAPFDVPWIGYDTGTYPEVFPYASQSADLNGDGAPDLAVVTIGGQAWLGILIGDGEGGYLPPETQPLQIDIVTTSAGVPTTTSLASVVLQPASVPTARGPLRIDVSAFNVQVQAGQVLGIAFTALPISPVTWKSVDFLGRAW